MPDLEALLLQHTQLANLPTDFVRSLVECATQVRAAPETVLFRQGEKANGCYFLLKGKVAIELDMPPKGRLVIQTIGQGDILGWSWLIEPYLWRFDTHAIEEVEAILLDGAQLRAKLATRPEMGFELLKRMLKLMGQRLEGARLQLLDIYGSHL